MTLLDTTLRTLLGLAGWGFAFFAGTINGVMTMDECIRRDSGMRMSLWILGSCSAIQAILMAVL